jgi:hypothetical protein
MSEMTKGERSELRTAVRMQFKVLRSDIMQRRAEVAESLLDEIDESFKERSKLETRVLRDFAAIVDEANSKARDVLSKEGLVLLDEARPIISITRSPVFAEQERISKKYRVEAKLNTTVAAALAELDRQEATMLRQLTLDAIEGDTARRFFDNIPTVSALVPMSRLAELEASMEEG